MSPIFSLDYAEFELANQIRKHFPKKRGYSVFVPLDRGEKAIDLVLVRKRPRGGSKCVTFQVKSSRTYSPRPRKNPRVAKEQYRTWYNVFDVQPEADFYLLFGIFYRDEPGKTERVGKRIDTITLLFTNVEMKRFMSRCRTKTGLPETKFAFGFDDNVERVVMTRGIQKRNKPDYTDHLLNRRFSLIAAAMS